MPLSTSTLSAVTGVISLLISAWRQSSIPTGHIVPVQVSNLNCDTVKLSWRPVEANLNVFNKLTSVDFEDGLKTVGVTLDRERKARFTVLSQVRDGNDNSYVLQSCEVSAQGLYDPQTQCCDTDFLVRCSEPIVGRLEELVEHESWSRDTAVHVSATNGPDQEKH